MEGVLLMAGSALRLLRRERLAALAEPSMAEEAMLSIVESISGGGTYGEICEANGLSWTELLMWLQADVGRWNAFLKAHEARALHLVSEAIAIADDTSRDKAVGKDGEVVVNGEVIARAKLRIDTRFKLAQHHAPGLYGKKVMHEHSATGDLGERLRRARERDMGSVVGEQAVDTMLEQKQLQKLNGTDDSI